MDPLSHVVLGATVSYALFGRRLGRRAAAVGALAGLTPDVDNFISSKEDPLLYVEYHRYFTHSFAFAIVGALIAALPWIMRHRFRHDWRRFWACSFVAYLSHCLLDASTTYGTQVFWPMTNQRVGWDLISIIDPVFTLTLGILLWIGLARRQRNWAVAGLIFGCAYLTLGGIQKARCARVQSELARQRGHTIERAEIMPTLANNLVWRTLYLTDGKIYSDRIRVGWFTGAAVREGNALPLATAEDLSPLETEGNRLTRGFERFAWFSDGWVARSPSDETIIGDMRYSLSSEAFDPIWGIRFRPQNGQVAGEWVSRQAKRKVSLRALWMEITGNDPAYVAFQK